MLQSIICGAQGHGLVGNIISLTTLKPNPRKRLKKIILNNTRAAPVSFAEHLVVYSCHYSLLESTVKKMIMF